jgi:hypothetical protein
LAAILACNMLGTAIAAMMAIIATTINSSISEKPCSLFMEILSYWLYGAFITRPVYPFANAVPDSHPF